MLISSEWNWLWNEDARTGFSPHLINPKSHALRSSLCLFKKSKIFSPFLSYSRLNYIGNMENPITLLGSEWKFPNILERPQSTDAVFKYSVLSYLRRNYFPGNSQTYHFTLQTIFSSFFLKCNRIFWFSRCVPWASLSVKIVLLDSRKWIWSEMWSDGRRSGVFLQRTISHT